MKNLLFITLFVAFAAASGAAAADVDKTEEKEVSKAIEEADKKAEKKGASKEEKKKMEKKAAKKAIKKYNKKGKKMTKRGFKRNFGKFNRRHGFKHELGKFDKLAKREFGRKRFPRKFGKFGKFGKSGRKGRRFHKRGQLSKKQLRQLKKNGKYIWLRKIVKQLEKKLSRRNSNKKFRKFAARNRAWKRRIMNDPFLKNVNQKPVAAAQTTTTNTANNNLLASSNDNNGYPIYKEDLSWSGYFWSYFGYPTRVKMDPNSELTQYMLNSGTKSTSIAVDSLTGVTYLRVTDGASTAFVSALIVSIIALVALLA